MPEEQKPTKPAAPAISAAAEQVVARVPDHYTGTDEAGFGAWKKAHRVQRTNELLVQSQNRYSKALGC